MLPKSLVLLAVLLLLLLTLAATSAEGGGGRGRRKDSRIHDAPPSDAEPDDDVDDDDDDDDEDRYKGPSSRRGGDHKYDHDSFLGREASRKFEEQSAEDSKKKLAELFGRIDTNNDTKISGAEMEAWLAEVAHQERVKRVEARFQGIKAAIGAKDLNSSMTFDDWRKAMHHEVIGDELADNETEAGFNQTMVKDHFRWQKADANGDKNIDKAEFADFLYAEFAPRMKEVIVSETLNTSDSNRDGKIDLPEYMHELYPDYVKEKQEGKKLPKWVVKEEEHFKMELDLSKDGFLDPEEIYKWTVPTDMDHTKRETKHLFETADDDKDKHLSKEEVMKNWETFVGHRVTHFGEFAPRGHDEL